MQCIKKWEKKDWGRVAHVLISEQCIVSHLEVEAGGYCSTHRHRYRTNLFFVITGKIQVDTFGTNPECHIIERGESAFVEAGTFHRFEVIESGTVIEVYGPGEGLDPKVSIDDIDRLNQGGMKK